ncbi:hypothetical protein HDU96_000205 [Phlyctochytrium bullatum]|nr:hypothetical protein HDU96_000205 [Phlyctochytrium bullatum]
MDGLSEYLELCVAQLEAMAKIVDETRRRAEAAEAAAAEEQRRAAEGLAPADGDAPSGVVGQRTAGTASFLAGPSEAAFHPVPRGQDHTGLRTPHTASNPWSMLQDLERQRTRERIGVGNDASRSSISPPTLILLGQGQAAVSDFTFPPRPSSAPPPTISSPTFPQNTFPTYLLEPRTSSAISSSGSGSVSPNSPPPVDWSAGGPYASSAPASKSTLDIISALAGMPRSVYALAGTPRSIISETGSALYPVSSLRDFAQSTSIEALDDLASLAASISPSASPVDISQVWDVTMGEAIPVAPSVGKTGVPVVTPSASSAFPASTTSGKARSHKRLGSPRWSPLEKNTALPSTAPAGAFAAPEAPEGLKPAVVEAWKAITSTTLPPPRVVEPATTPAPLPPLHLSKASQSLHATCTDCKASLCLLVLHSNARNQDADATSFQHRVTCTTCTGIRSPHLLATSHASRPPAHGLALVQASLTAAAATASSGLLDAIPDPAGGTGLPVNALKRSRAKDGFGAEATLYCDACWRRVGFGGVVCKGEGEEVKWMDAESGMEALCEECTFAPNAVAVAHTEPENGDLASSSKLADVPAVSPTTASAH